MASKYKRGLEAIGLMSHEDIKEAKAELGNFVRVHQFPPLKPVPQAGGWVALAMVEAIVISALVAYCWYKKIQFGL